MYGHLAALTQFIHQFCHLLLAACHLLSLTLVRSVDILYVKFYADTDRLKCSGVR